MIGIYVPSAGRAGKIATLLAIPRKLLKDTWLCVPKDQLSDYAVELPLGLSLLEHPNSVKGIASKRDWMVGHAIRQGYKYIVMIDDDVVFAKRRKDDLTKFEAMHGEDYENMFRRLFAELKTSGHVGMLSREGGNRVTSKMVHNTRMTRVLGYELKILQNTREKFSDMPLMEDFHMTLALLRKGIGNTVLCDYVHNQGSSNAPGGCSTYRTPELQSQAAHKLAELHSGFVKVMQKETKTAWGGGARTDVVVSWKKAFGSSEK
jgi:hypothetical protein